MQLDNKVMMFAQITCNWWSAELKKPSLPSARMRSEGTVVGSVCLCVCVSVTQHLTFPMFVCLTNNMTYLTGNEGQNFRVVLSENTVLQS